MMGVWADFNNLINMPTIQILGAALHVWQNSPIHIPLLDFYFPRAWANRGMGKNLVDFPLVGLK